MPAPIQPSSTNRSVFPYVRSKISEGVSLLSIREDVEGRWPNYRTRGSRLAFHIDVACCEFLFAAGKTNAEVYAYLCSPIGSERCHLWSLDKVENRRSRYNAYITNHASRFDEMIRAAAPVVNIEVPRRRGRPVGSRNNSGVSGVRSVLEVMDELVSRSNRPSTSLNEDIATLIPINPPSILAPESPSILAPEYEGITLRPRRGRPVGSRNVGSRNRTTAEAVVIPTPENRTEVRDAVEEITSAQTPFDNTRTYGIEVEFLYPHTLSPEDIARKLSDVGIPCQTENYNHITKRYWKIVSDSSVQTNTDRQRQDFCGGKELVSPILKGEEGFEKIEKALKVLRDIGCTVNNTCGLHVHFGIKKASKPEVVRNAIKLYENFKHEFDAILPLSRRNNGHCRHYGVNLDNVKNSRDLQFFRRSDSRYFTVNACALDRHNTCEFRQHSATLDSVKVLAWIKICQRVMARSEQIKDAFEITLKPSIFTELGIVGDLKEYMEKRKVQIASRAPVIR